MRGGDLSDDAFGPGGREEHDKGLHLGSGIDGNGVGRALVEKEKGVVGHGNAAASYRIFGRPVEHAFDGEPGIVAARLELERPLVQDAGRRESVATVSLSVSDRGHEGTVACAES